MEFNVFKFIWKTDWSLAIGGGWQESKTKSSQKQKIFADYKKKLAGYFGEKEVHYYLQSLNKDQYHIIHNIRLNVSNQYFQIDFLILTTSYFVILEVKNFIGKVTFNDFNQMILTKHDQTQESIQNPITQSERQVLHLQNWLLQNSFPYIPIYSYVVFSSPTTLLINNSGNQDVSKKNNFRFKHRSSNNKFVESVR